MVAVGSTKEWQLHIGLDLDDVTGNFAALKARTAERLYGVKVLPEVVEWHALIPYMLSVAAHQALLKAINTDPEIALTMEPLPGAFQTMRQLMADGHTLTIITSRGGQSLNIARQWMANHDFDIEVIGTNGQSKALVTDGLDVFFEDNPSKLRDMRNVPYLFVLNNSLNSRQQVPEGTQRVNNWAEFYQRIGALAAAPEQLAQATS